MKAPLKLQFYARKAGKREKGEILSSFRGLDTERLPLSDRMPNFFPSGNIQKKEAPFSIPEMFL